MTKQVLLTEHDNKPKRQSMIAFDNYGQRLLAVFIALAIIMSATSVSIDASSQQTEIETKTLAVKTYPQGLFADVAANQWYSDAVKVMYETGLMVGSNNQFYPNKPMTVAECLTILARLVDLIGNSSLAYFLDRYAANASKWYEPYVEYLLSQPGEFGVYTALNVPTDRVLQRNCTRAEFCHFFYDKLLAHINSVRFVTIPDTIPEEHNAAVKAMVYAGIINGIDATGTFSPNATITRAQAATIIARIIRPETRFRNSIASDLPAYERAKKAGNGSLALNPDGPGLIYANGNTSLAMKSTYLDSRYLAGVVKSASGIVDYETMAQNLDIDGITQKGTAKAITGLYDNVRKRTVTYMEAVQTINSGADCRGRFTTNVFASMDSESVSWNGYTGPNMWAAGGDANGYRFAPDEHYLGLTFHHNTKFPNDVTPVSNMDIHLTYDDSYADTETRIKNFDAAMNVIYEKWSNIPKTERDRIHKLAAVEFIETTIASGPKSTQFAKELASSIGFETVNYYSMNTHAGHASIPFISLNGFNFLLSLDVYSSNTSISIVSTTVGEYTEAEKWAVSYDCGAFSVVDMKLSSAACDEIINKYLTRNKEKEWVGFLVQPEQTSAFSKNFVITYVMPRLDELRKYTISQTKYYTEVYKKYFAAGPNSNPW